jgi:GNAT superfamily N-acetyltransferase
VEQITDEVVQAFGRLLPQLSRSAPALDASALGVVAHFSGNRLLVARVDGEVVGTLTLVTFPIPTGLRAWIEDVVVDEASRGSGVGAALTQAAIRLAHTAGARTVELTSRRRARRQTRCMSGWASRYATRRSTDSAIRHRSDPRQARSQLTRAARAIHICRVVSGAWKAVAVTPRTRHQADRRAVGAYERALHGAVTGRVMESRCGG